MEALVQGWGRGREKWDIDHTVINGGPEDQDTWDRLELHIISTFRHIDGQNLPIKIVGIDSGYSSQQVYNFCEKFDQRKVIALKGFDKLSTMVSTPKSVSVKESGKRIKKGVKLWGIATHMIKSELYADLQKMPPDDLLEGYPPGYIHFPQFDEDYFKQLTAEERRVTKNKKGIAVIEWVKIRDRNEILDLHVYGRALAHIVGIDRLNESGWQKLESQIKLASKLKTKENRKQERINRRKKKRKKSDYWDR